MPPNVRPIVHPRRISHAERLGEASRCKDQSYGLHRMPAHRSGTLRNGVQPHRGRAETRMANRSRRTAGHSRAPSLPSRRGRCARARHWSILPGKESNEWERPRQGFHPASFAVWRGAANRCWLWGRRQASRGENSGLTKAHPYLVFPDNQDSGVPRGLLPTASVALPLRTLRRVRTHRPSCAQAPR